MPAAEPQDVDVELARLSRLPVLDKSLLMKHFDGLVCDPRLRRDELLNWVGRSPATSSHKTSFLGFVHGTRPRVDSARRSVQGGVGVREAARTRVGRGRPPR
jgi:hypothetical protein